MECLRLLFIPFSQHSENNNNDIRDGKRMNIYIFIDVYKSILITKMDYIHPCSSFYYDNNNYYYYIECKYRHSNYILEIHTMCSSLIQILLFMHVNTISRWM